MKRPLAALIGLLTVTASVASAQVSKPRPAERMRVPKPLPVGRVSPARFDAIRDAGNKLEAAWTSGASSLQLRDLNRALEAELTAMQGYEITEADRLFMKAVKLAANAFSAGMDIVDAQTDESRRPAAEEAARQFGVGNILWDSPEKATVVLDQGAAFLLAASHFHGGRIGQALGIEDILFREAGDRRRAGMNRPMMTGEATSIYRRLYSDRSDIRKTAIADASAFGKSATMFEDRLRELAGDEDASVSTAASDALDRVALN